MTTLDPDQQTDQDGGDENATIRQMREALKAKDAEIADLRGFRETAEPQLRRAALKDAGFDPDSKLAEAVLRLHEGDLTAEAIRETATTFEIPVGEGAPAPQQQLSDEQQQALDAQQRIDGLNANGTPGSAPQTIAEKRKAAEESGDLEAMKAVEAEAAAAFYQGRS